MNLQGYAERPDVVVMALGAGGIPVGYELALRLGLELVLFDRDAIEKLVPESTIILAVDGVETAESIVPSLQTLRAEHVGDVFSPPTDADAGQLLGYASRRWRAFSLHGTHRWW